MNVTCERCHADYEFDDSLVTRRGTSVKCTNCGHRFKVFAPATDATEDYFVVTTTDGRKLVFASLRELQAALREGKVGREDVVSRGGLTPKRVGSVSELDQLVGAFREAASASLVPAAARAPLESLPLQLVSQAPTEPPPETPGAELVIPVAPRTPAADTLASLAAAASVPDAPAEPDAVLSDAGESPVASTGNSVSDDAASPGEPEPNEGLESSSNRPDHHPPRSLHVRSPLEPRPRVPVPSDDSLHDLGPESISPPSLLLARRQSRVSLWIASALVLSACFALLVLRIQSQTGGVVAPDASVSAGLEGRVAGLLAAGEQACAEGDWELCKELFDKAAALVETDARVRVGQARLAIARAAGAWLTVRLLPAEAAKDRRSAMREFEQLAQRAGAAAEGVERDDPNGILKSEVRSLLLGEGAGVSSDSKQYVDSPQSAFARAIAVMSAPPVRWHAAVNLLRVAADLDSTAFRSRAVLVYALASSGDFTAAATELERLSSISPQHTLVHDLAAYLERLEQSPSDTDASVSRAAMLAADGSSPKAADAEGRDSTLMVSLADRARARGDWAEARSYYSAVLRDRPGHSEALSGLGLVAFAERDFAKARGYFKRASAINPHYIPALVGLADCDWETGAKTEAVKQYKDIAERFAEGSFPARVRQRAEGGG